MKLLLSAIMARRPFDPAKAKTYTLKLYCVFDCPSELYFLRLIMSVSSKAAASQLVHHHLSSLVSEARRIGVSLDDLTLELVAHANCAALSFWTEEDLHGLLEAAAAESNAQNQAELAVVAPFGRA